MFTPSLNCVPKKILNFVAAKASRKRDIFLFKCRCPGQVWVPPSMLWNLLSTKQQGHEAK
jgi:hypothetical protein